MNGLEIKIAPVLILGIQVVLLAHFAAGSSWYQGCIHDNASSLVSESLLEDLRGNLVFTPASCASSCLDRGFQYAGLQGANNCRCSNIVGEFGEEAGDQICNITCGNASLPCGGDSAVSVYSVDGPYLLTAQLSKTQHLVQEGSTVRFEARVSLAADVVFDTGLDGFNASNFDGIVFTWSVDGVEIGRTSRSYVNSSAVDSFVYTFNHEGRWRVDVEVSNPISSLSRTTSIIVVQPVPSDLQVILRPTQGDSPSCVPVSATTSLPTVSVFVGEEVEFQASVAMGINLTFVWMFDEDSSRMNVTQLLAEEPQCVGIACMQDTQTHTFTAEGRYNVVVNVSNYLGSIQKTLHVVVVNREITNLTMSLSSNSAYVNKVNDSLGLLITMVATAREQVLLEVDFGDGSLYNHSMYDVNDTFITVGDEDSAHLHLTASYGEGCTLFVSLSHRYRHAGVFTVEAKIFQKWNSESVGSARLDSAVIVQDELRPIQMETQQVYSTNTLANFSVVAPVVITNISFLWSVSSDNGTLSLDCEQEPTCLHNFTKPGQYVVKVTALNLVSASHAQETVTVQEAVRGLVLIGGSGGILATGTTVSFMASLLAGSDVQFTWHFSDVLGMTVQRDGTSNSLPFSHTNHTYYTSGMYNVSVTARNQVSSQTAHLPQGILVQDPVLGLSLVSSGPTLLGDPTHINVTLLQGTHVAFTVITELGQVTPGEHHLEEDNTYILELTLNNPGVYHATVVASNSISAENATLCLAVQESIGTVSIQEFYPGNGQMLLLARLDGEIPNRTDVMYTWLVRGDNITSASPLLVLPVCLHPELVSLQASNQVNANQVELLVDSSSPQTGFSLDYPTFGETGESLSWSFQISEGATSLPVQVLVSHGDGSPNTSHTVTPGTPITGNHTYPYPGIYAPCLWISLDGEDLKAESIVAIEQTISDVELTGPGISKFFGSVTTQTWEVMPASGTDILYTWSIQPVSTDYSHGTETDAAVNMTPLSLAASHGKVSIPFYAPGHYNITLQASNLISSVTLHSETTLQQPIVEATVHVDAALIGTPSTYQIVVKGGPPFQFEIDFGMDGEFVSVTSEDLASQGNELIDYLFDPPVCVYTLDETYPSLGWYDSSFMISNLISEETVTATAKVEEWISGLTITSESSSLVQIGFSVVLEATVETGNDVDFAWDFQDVGREPTLQNCLNASIATHTFSRPGTYQVSVSASNFLQPQPLTAIYPQPFLVQELPFALELRPPAGQAQGAPLYDYGDYWATSVLSFEAHCWGSHLVFYFNYGDGTIERVVGVLDEFGSYNAAGSHRYFEEGNYTVSVSAGNQLGNVTQYLSEPYFVQVPPTSLRCENSYYTHVFGNVSQLSVMVEAGTHLFYNWSMGDQTDYIDVGPAVNHIYRSAGRFLVTVVAFNKVQKAHATCIVSVEVQVQGVQLVVEKRLYQTHSPITFEAVTITQSALWYEWDMGDQKDPRNTSVNTLTYQYTFHGRYYVTVLAGNHVSNATSPPIELTLQTAIQRVTINSQSATLVNQTTLFEAWVFVGSDTSFVWDFGDGTDKVYTSALSVHHKYTRTGEFYVRLEASNLVSNSTALSKIFVLTRMCHPPVLDIVGDDPRSVKHSEDIRIEAEVIIDCEVTNLALYTWQVTYADNGSVVALDQSIASLNQRTLFIPRRYLPYGSYTFALDVVMNGTIVYAHDSITIEVTRSALMSIIEGGTRRYFSRDMTAKLNGSLSYDPDNPEDDNLRYNWTCHPLNLPGAPCFNATALSLANQTSVLPSLNISLVFPTSWLLLNSSSSFVFTLKVSKEGRTDVEATQVLSLVHEEMGERHMEVSIECYKCEDGFINANEQLTLEAVCHDCDENTTYRWELYVVLDGTTSDSTFESTPGRRCVPGDGSYGQYLVANESSPLSPSSNPEEDTNIIDQSTQTTGTSTPQNSVSNAINSGLAGSDGSEVTGLGSSQPNSTVAFEGSATATTALGLGEGADTGGSLQEGSIAEGVGSLTEDVFSSLDEDIGTNTDVVPPGSLIEDTAGTVAAVASFVEDLGNSSILPTSVAENAGSFEEAGGSLEEVSGSVEEAGNSFVEAVGSLQEAGGSLEEGDGSLTEAVGSLQEAGGSLVEDVASVVEDGGSLVEGGGSLVEDGGSLAEAIGSLVEDSGSLAEAGASLEEAGGSLMEAGGSLAEADGNLTEAGGSLMEAGGSLAGADGNLTEAGASLEEDGESLVEAGGSFVEADRNLTEAGASLEEAGGSLVEAGGSFVEADRNLTDPGASLVESVGSLVEAGGSFEEAVGSLTEAGGSLEEVGGSLEEAGGSFEEVVGNLTEAGGSFEEAVDIEETGESLAEAGGSFVEAGGSFEEAGGSLDEAAGGSIAEDSLLESLPGSSGSNDTGASSVHEAEGSITETSDGLQLPGNPGDSNYEEALYSSYVNTGASASQPSQNASQPVDAVDYYEDDSYPEEYLSSSDEPGLSPPAPPDTDTDTDNSNNNGDPVVNTDVEPVISEHAVSKSRQQIVLPPEDTTTGLTGRALIIKEGILEENRTYALVVSIHKSDNGVVRTGEAHQYALVNTGPRSGLCSITPDNGNEMDTVFTINCLGWEDKHTPIQYEVSYSLNETEDLTILYFGMKHAVKFQLPAGYFDNNHLVYVKVAIVDGEGGKTSVCSIDIQVLPKMFSPGESIEEFLYNVSVAPMNLLSLYVEQGDQHKLNGFINMVACILNRQPALTGTHSNYTRLVSLRRQIRFALVSASVALPMRDQFEIQQSSMATAASSYVPLELQVNTIILAAELIDSCKTKAVANVALVGELDVDILVALTSTLSSVVSALAMDHTQGIRPRNRKSAVEGAVGAVSELLQTHLHQQKPDEEPLLIQTSSVDLLGARQTSLAAVDLSIGHNSFLLPSSIEQVLYSLNGHELSGGYICHGMTIPCWDVDMFTYQANPYKWGDGADKVTTGVSSLSLHSCAGQKLVVENLTAGREIVFEAMHSVSLQGDSPVFDDTINKAFMNVHEFNVSLENIGQTFQILLRLAPETRRTFPVKVIMRYGARPTPTAYDRSWLYQNEEDDLVIFLPPNTFNVSGIYYVGLIDAQYGESTYRQDEVSERQYLIRLWWGECLYWNTAHDAWVGDGCEVMPSSTYELTRCRCNHLTAFGVSFLPLSTILEIVDLVVFETPNVNPITHSLMAGILGIYVLLLIYCRLADKHDERKLGLIYLWDNQPSDQQYYEITVETGMRAGAGTTARVSVVLHGEEGHSETKELTCKGRPIFEKNSRDRFIVSVSESLGNIQRVHVWHNNAGLSPSWFLSRIAVRDLITGQKWYFICERWFAVEEDDGKIERELEALDKGVGFQKAFFAKLFQYFADYYLWSSVFTRPPYSVFTRVQRLTCCLCISMGFLCINTIWYQHLDKEEMELGLIDVSGEAMLVGIVTALLAIPINFPVIMVFRRIRPRREEIEEEKNFRSVKTTIELPESAEPVETILNQERLDSGASEHPDVALHDLQAWAQEKWKHRFKSSSNQSENTRSSYDSFSFGSSTYDDALSTHSISGSSNASKRPGEISDSGVSSPDTRSLQSSDFGAFYQMDHKRLSSPKFWLPSWCGKLAWGICGFITVFSVLVVVYYGYRFSDVKAVYWMQSVYFSFLQCIFVTQPAVMLMFTIVKSVRHRNNIRIFDHYDDNIDLIDKKSLERARLEVYENDMAKAIAARQRSRYLRFARPPQEKELQKAKEKTLKEKNMWAILKDVIMYTTLFACLMWMAYGREVAFHHPVNQGIRQTYLQTPHPFTRISTVDELWVWLNEDLLDGLYWERWYNGETVSEEKNSIMNGESVLLGQASLRQVRVRHYSCPIPKPARSLFHDCKSGYSLSMHSTEPYGPNGMWTHFSKGVLRRYCKWGYFGSYEGDGYAINLNGSREEAKSQLQFLQNNSWIDDQTRAVIVEFTVYNAPTNLYTSVALLAEMPGTGAINPLPKIESILLYRYETVYDYFIMCCELLFLLLVAVSGKREVQKLVKIKAKFFKSTWSWMEMGMILLSLTYFAMYVCRFMYVNNITHHLRGTYMEEFVDMSLLAYWDQILKDLLASLIFLASVKFLRLLRFNQTVAMFGAVIDGAIKEILTFALYMLVLEAAFACLGVLLFSTHFYPLKHLYVSTNLLNAMIVGHPPDSQDLAAEFPIMWHMFYFVYVVGMIILMAGLIKAILCHSYKQVKQRHIQAVGGKEVVCFFWNKFLIRVGIRKLPEEDKPTALPTEFTMAEIEYQVDELLFRMSAISHQHGLPEKPYGYFEDSDGTHGMMEDGMSSTCSELNLFDNARLEDRVQKIETQLYSHNPELRELLDGNCFTDEDREKQLRAHLEMEIFRQLQLQRQEEYRLQHELHDSGHDTQSTSEHMELGSDDVSLDHPQAPLNIRDAQGRPSFPKPMQNLGTLEMQTSTRPPPSMFTNLKQAWGQPGSAQEVLVSKGPLAAQEPKRVAIPHNRPTERFQSTGDTAQRPHTTGMQDKCKASSSKIKPVSASFVRRDPQLLSSSEVLDSQSSSSSSYVHRTDSLSSHASDLVTSQVNEALSTSNRSWENLRMRDRSDHTRPESHTNLDDLVRDYPQGAKPPVERAVSVESFPLPNALEGLSSSSGNEDGKSSRNKGSKESEARHRLRKTRSRGKGKGRRRYDESVYVNEAFSTDSEDDIPVIQMGPVMHHDR